jgi:hypothetical protein
MFEKEADMGVAYPQGALAETIDERPEDFREEFADLAKQAKKLYHERADIVRSSDDAADYWPDSDDSPEADELTFSEFAEVEAASKLRAAREMMKRIITDHGYVNRDDDDYATRIVTIDGKPSVQLVNYDLEYYRHDPDLAQRIVGNRERSKQDEVHVQRRTDMRDIRIAAEYAMLAREGANLPKPLRPNGDIISKASVEDWNSEWANYSDTAVPAPEPGAELAPQTARGGRLRRWLGRFSIR